MRTPRKLKKKESKKGTLIYDVCGMPSLYSIRQIVFEFERHGIVVWASKANENLSGRDCNHPPTVINNLRGLKIVDLSETNSTLS